jgi:hypothetical protein
MDIVQSNFNLLMSSLNRRAAKAAFIDDNEQVELLEDAMSELLDAWTDYVMSDVKLDFTKEYFMWSNKINSWH